MKATKKLPLFYRGLQIFLPLSLGLTATLVVLLVTYILVRGLPHLRWELLTSSPSYLSQKLGILPDLVNTLYLLFTTLVIALPLSVGAAIYLNEYAQSPRLKRRIEGAAEILGGIPSIIYGLVGMLMFANHFGTGLLAGSLTLVMMNIPVLLRATQESLKTVPDSYREGAYALGAGKWQLLRTVVLPSCMDGILSGVILSAGRILGESAALLFTAGFAHQLNGYLEGLRSPGASLTVALYVYAKEQGEFEVAFAIAAVLLLLTLLLNLLAMAIQRRFQARTAR